LNEKKKENYLKDSVEFRLYKSFDVENSATLLITLRWHISI